jgi:hypothetical protein
LEGLRGNHSSDGVNQRSRRKILRPYSVRIDSGSDDNQSRLSVQVGFLFGVQSEFFRDKLSSFPIGLQNAASTLQEISSNLLQISSRKLSRLPIKLNNTARAYQDSLRKATGLVWRLRLIRAQEGLVLNVTSQDCLVHWLGTFPRAVTLD